MKKWKIVWTIITGTIFSHEFDTIEEMERWWAERAEGLEPITESLAVWELWNGEYKLRHNKRA